MTMRQVLSDKIKEALTEPKHFKQIEDELDKEQA